LLFSGSVKYWNFWKVFVVVLFVFLLIFELLAFAVQPYVECAGSETFKDALRQLALGFLEQVAQVNLTNYNVTSNVMKFYLPQSIHYVIDVEVKLQKGNDTLDFLFYYIDGWKLWWYDGAQYGKGFWREPVMNRQETGHSTTLC
jgi:hypothetical protein